MILWLEEIDNGYYLFNSDGSMVTNWSYVNGNWYYFSSDGLMRTGWQWIGNKWYYFYYEMIHMVEFMVPWRELRQLMVGNYRLMVVC